MGFNKNFIDVKHSFWEEYPIFKVTGPFKEFHFTDKTSKKIFTSTVMWSITKICDSDSEFAQSPLEDRINEIFDDMIGSISTTKKDWHVKYRTKLNNLMKAYTDLTTSKLEKALVNHENKFIERAEYINGLNYKEHCDILEKLLPATSKIANELEDARKKVMAEKDKGTNKGGIETSLSDDGAI